MAKNISAPTSLTVADVCTQLDAIAPPALAAEWDNVGLLIGDRRQKVRRVMLTIDLTADVLQEAIASGVQMVMAYHPPIFKPITRLTGAAAPVVLATARAGLAVHSMHTALDAAPGGTDDTLAELLGLVDTGPLVNWAGQGQYKLVVFVPPQSWSQVAQAAFSAGAGSIGNYTECSFRGGGAGTFFGQEGSNPAVGRAGRREEVMELRLETVVPRAKLAAVVAAVRQAHPYETPAIDVIELAALPSGAGLGRQGRLSRPTSLAGLVGRVKRTLGTGNVLVAGRVGGSIRRAACSAGSADREVLSAVIAGQAQVYVTGEMRHHDALAIARAGKAVICVGHSNSERPVLTRVAGRLKKSLPGLDVVISKRDRDPFEIE